MQSAKRHLPKKYFTVSLYSNNRLNPVTLRISSFFLYFFLGFVLFTLSFTFYTKKSIPAILSKTKDIDQKKITNKLQETKITLTLNKNQFLKERIHQLKIQEAQIKELLSLNFDGEKSHNVELFDYTMINTHRIVSRHGEYGRVLVNDKVVVEYFDDSKNPSAYRRALVTAERIKSLLANKRHTSFRFQVKQKGDKVFGYANTQILFVIYPADIEKNYLDITQKDLADQWLKNIKNSIHNKKEQDIKKTLISKIPILDRDFRKQSKIYQPIYTHIDYPAHTALAQNDPETNNIDHLLKLAQQEITTYRKSFSDLKNTIAAYKKRFYYTPSRYPSYNSFILSPFGWRIHPITRKVKFHTGIDIPTWRDAPVIATAGGKVTKATWNSGYGHMVEIDHGYGFSTRYAHNSRLIVHVGQRIRKGQTIAKAGMSGLAQGIHVHYEVRFFGRPVNPEKFLNLNIFTASKNW